ncbi:hypothetical protein [Variovorax sp. Root411]|uniref:hypothetical protein n=1 Tax=Variovorax sp. Root411 TaxID=1736530 RepID=UPI0006F46945|nr:hypothetical protein [Variovorax sp. Root411]KQW54020.1 hypothetical protein ASC92_22035 [Variovorax sp. Root411]
MPSPQLSLNTTTRSHYGENDELEVAVAVSGSVIFGSVVAYDDHRKLSAICKVLAGFPQHAGDSTSFDYGIFDRLRVNLTTDAKGNVGVTAVLEKWGGPAAKYSESMSVQFWCGPSGLDEFCSAIAALEPDMPAEAHLLGRADL